MTELLIPFAVLGWLFVSLLIIGLMTNGKQCAIAPDQWAGTCLIAGHMADETISAWAHWLFYDPLHCAKAYEAEMQHEQNNPIYRKE